MFARFASGFAKPNRASGILIALMVVAGPGDALAYRYFSDHGPKMPATCRLPSLTGNYAEIRPRVLRLGFRPVTKDADCGFDCKRFPERQFCGVDNSRCEFLFRDVAGHELLLKTDDEISTPEKYVYGWEMDCDAKPLPPKPPFSIKPRPVKPIPLDLSLPSLPAANGH